MDTTDAFRTFVLCGTRLDSTTLPRATAAAWEGALSRAGLRVMLVDMWTLLLGQRDFSVWEALSAADFVYPIADDVLLRRTAQRQGMMVMKSDLILYDLLDAAARANRPVVFLAPPVEADSDVALVRRIWPQLQVTALTRGEDEFFEPDRKLVSAVNAAAPALLILGGYSPWQEQFVHIYRDELEYGTSLIMPILHTAMADIGQRVGIPVTGIGRMRRKAAISRALTTTLRPAAEASAEALGTWLAGARHGLSAALHPQQSSPALRRIAAIESPRSPRSVSVRMLPPGDAEESSSRWAATSPLKRIKPLALPALPAPGSSAPSRSAARWVAPPATRSGSAMAGKLPAGAPPGPSQHDESPTTDAVVPSGFARSPFGPPPGEDHPAAEASSPAPDDVSAQQTAWLAPLERGPWSSGLRPAGSAASGPVPDVPAEREQVTTERSALPPAGASGEPPDDEYDTFVVDGGELRIVEAAGDEPLAGSGAAADATERDGSQDATRLLADGAAREPAPPDQVGPTTRLRPRNTSPAKVPDAAHDAPAAPTAGQPDADPEALRVLATIDDLPPTRQLNERAVNGAPPQRPGTPAPEREPADDASEPARAAEDATPQPTQDGEPATAAEAPRPYTRISRKYVVRRMPRHIGHQRGRPRR